MEEGVEFKSATIPDVILIRPRVYSDERGFFMETYHQREFRENGIEAEFVQDNHSRSRQGTLRGLHYQIRNPQGKLVRVVAGEVYDVAVDLRRQSMTFGRWIGMSLSAENRQQIWIPPGFAHGFYVLSEWAEFVYKATDYYAPEWERILLWKDPDLGIEWPLAGDKAPTISSKDARGIPLKKAEAYE
jgi:dTDP-4-dehydrorhamnose 3,5-epimerase